jgi:hypothetical protein
LFRGVVVSVVNVYCLAALGLVLDALLVVQVVVTAVLTAPRIVLVCPLAVGKLYAIPLQLILAAVLTVHTVIGGVVLI